MMKKPHSEFAVGLLALALETFPSAISVSPLTVDHAASTREAT
jgi:hypothetical protein